MTGADDELSPSADASADDPDWPLVRGRQLIQSGQALAAVSHYEAALAKRPDDPALNLHLARALMMIDRAGEARASLRKALSSKGLGPVAWFELGLAEQRCGRFARAAIAYRRSALGRPTWFEAQLHAAQALLALGKRTLALAHARAATDIRPQSPQALHLLGVTLALTRQFTEAARVFEAWSQVDGLDPGPELYRARALRLAGDTNAAQAACLKALERRPDHLRALYLIAKLALGADDLPKAQIYWHKLAQALPDRPAIRVQFGQVLLRRAQFQSAKDQARKALGIDPTSAPALALLVEAHLACGEALKARDALAEFDGRRQGDSGLAALSAEVARRLDQRVARAAPALKTRKGRTTTGAPPPRFVPQSRDATPKSAWVTRPKTPTYFSGLEIVDHIAILRALILNDLRLKYRGNSLGFVLEILRPTLVIAAHYYLFVLVRKPMPANLPIVTFVIAGFPVWFAFNGALQAGSHGTRSAAQAILLPQVTMFHVKLAKASWAVLLNFVFCLCASWPLIFFFRQDLSLPDIPTSAVIFILSGSMGFGLGLISEQMSKRWPIVDIFTKLLAWALYVTSGQYFSIMTVERGWAQFLWFNPLIHLVEYERHAFDPGYPIAVVNLGYPAAFAVSLMMLALMGKKAARRGAFA